MSLAAPLVSESARRRDGVWRRRVGATVFGALVWFPGGLVALPIVGALWLGEARLRERFGWRGWIVTVLWCAIAAANTFTLGRLGPFLAPSDWWWAFAAAVAALVLSSWPPAARRRALWRTLCVAVPLAMAPPMPPGLVTRLVILVAAAAGFTLFQRLVGTEVGKRMVPPAWAFAVLVPSVALRALLFWLLPTADPAPVLAAIPGAELVMPSWPNVHLGHRYGMPINWHDLRVAMAGCEPGSRIVGTLDALYFRAPGGINWNEVRFPPGDQLALDCKRGKVWVPEMVKEKLWAVDLATHAVEKPFEHCDFAGPTVVSFDREGRELYGYPGGEHLAAFDPETFACRRVLDGGTIMGFSVSKSRGDGLVVRNGRLERCTLDGSGRCDLWLRLYDERLPRWLQRDGWNKATLVNHFNKVIEDPDGRVVFATSLQSGRVYRVDRASGALLGSKFLEPGIRWVQLDADRRRLYVGGFVRGHLFVLDPDTLAVERRAFLGRKIRYFEPLADGRLLLATSAGILELDPSQLPPSEAVP